MKAFIVFVACLAVASCADECYRSVDETCSNKVSKKAEALTQCDAKYGAITTLETDLQQFANHLIYRSFDLLLMATHYGNYIKNRAGFQQLFQDHSDNLWSGGIDAIKYITQRGGQMNFGNIPTILSTEKSQQWELFELQALGRDLDIQKELAKHAFAIHKTASGHNEHHDPEVAHHLEEEYMEKQRDNIRELAGHVKDLSSILEGPDASLGVYLFDEYLQKKNTA